MTRMNIFFVSSRRIQTLPNANLSESLYDHFADLPIEQRDRPHVVAFAPNKPIKNRGDAKVQEDVAALGDLSSGDTAQRIDAYVPLSKVLPMGPDDNDVHIILKGLPVTLRIYVKDTGTFRVVEIPETTNLYKISSYIKRDSISAVYTPRDAIAYNVDSEQEIGKAISGLPEADLKKQDLTHTIGKVFPGAIPPDVVHLIVTAIPQEEEPPLKRQRSSHHGTLTPDDGSTKIWRRHLIPAIKEKVQEHGLVHVRGTPGSGKSVLARQLVHSYQRDHKFVVSVDHWTIEKTEWSERLAPRGFIDQSGQIFILDEAQMSYTDIGLWNAFKAPRDYFGGVILLSSYGSTAEARGQTPPVVSSDQQINLRSVDSSNTPGLLFTKEEFDLFIERSEYSNFSADLLDQVFVHTRGHVGAFAEFLSKLAIQPSYRRSMEEGKLYTWDDFNRTIEPSEWLNIIRHNGFGRGLPNATDYMDLEIVDTLADMLTRHSIIQAPLEQLVASTSPQSGLIKCIRRGWFASSPYAASPSGSADDTMIYEFASPLHKWVIQYKLRPPPVPISIPLTDFCWEVIKRFSRATLTAVRSVNVQYQRTPEAQYQDEFYRCCQEAARFNIIQSELGNGKGRIDFYMPAKKWGIELLRDGKNLKEHIGRFSHPGSYKGILQTTDYIILDFRQSEPQAAVSNSKAFFVVFSKDYYTCKVKNHQLDEVVTFPLLN